MLQPYICIRRILATITNDKLYIHYKKAQQKQNRIIDWNLNIQKCKTKAPSTVTSFQFQTPSKCPTSAIHDFTVL